jgi:DNA-binding NtrC family response regulator
MSAPTIRPLVVVVLGGPGDADLVPADPGIDCRRVAESGPADVLIVNLDEPIEEPDEGPLDAIRRAFDPELPVVILALSRDPTRAASALAAGATDFMLLPRDRRWLRDAILRERDRPRPSGGYSGPRPDGGTERLIVDIPLEGLPFEEFERRVVAHALARNGWNRSRAARELGISRPRLLRKIERHGLEAPPRASAEPPTR